VTRDSKWNAAYILYFAQTLTMLPYSTHTYMATKYAHVSQRILMSLHLIGMTGFL